MRLLVFEYITGGGFIDQDLPVSLLQEGRLMLHALLNDLSVINTLELLVLRDERIGIDSATISMPLQYITVSCGQVLTDLLTTRQASYDAVWIIAPESDGVLAFWCQFFSQQSKCLANSGLQTVEICADKYRTFMLLHNAGIACVPSQLIKASTVCNDLPIILKASNSAGCDEVYLIESECQWGKVLQQLKPERQYILQPYVIGKVLSLSCLFYRGRAYLLCCNEQHITHIEQGFSLSACTVNVQAEKHAQYQVLCQQIVNIMPQLLGYIGIDFIQTDKGENLILEINPRLTSSYAGMQEALGINVAELVLAMLRHKSPIINKRKNKQVTVEIIKGEGSAG